MPTWITLREMFLNKKCFPNPEQLFIDYSPNPGQLVLAEEITGCKKEQTISTEECLGGWHAANENQLISHDATNSELDFQGKIGHDHFVRTLQRVTRECYSQNDLNAFGGCPTIDDVNQLSQWLKYTPRRDVTYWLANTKEDVSPLYTTFYFVFCVNEKLYDNLYKAFCSDYSGPYAIRPIVNLPLGLMIYVGDDYYNGSSPSKALKIKRYTSVSELKVIELSKKITNLESVLEKERQKVEKMENDIRKLTEMLSNKSQTG